MIRTVPCEQDARVSKFLYHYEKLNIKVIIACISRDKNCERQNSAYIRHVTVKASNFNKLNRIQILILKICKSFRILLLIDHLINSLKIRKICKPRILHGCDLDGYLISKVAFPLNPNRIFEVYDPWSTMTTSKRIHKIENREFFKAKVLVLPAKDSRIKVVRENSFSMSNMLDPGLLNLIELKEDSKRINLDINNDGKPFILTGGIINQDTKIRELIEAIGLQNKYKLLITSDTQLIEVLGIQKNPFNVQFIGKQKWPEWLALMKKSAAVWVYYSTQNEHFKSHISPNKYWEACLLGTPILVNNISQFCDRVDFEPNIIEIGEDLNMKERILASLAEIKADKKNFNELEIHEYWAKKESERTLTVQELLKNFS